MTRDQILAKVAAKADLTGADLTGANSKASDRPRRSAAESVMCVIPCHRGGHNCNWPACHQDCDGRRTRYYDLAGDPIGRALTRTATGWIIIYTGFHSPWVVYHSDQEFFECETRDDARDCYLAMLKRAGVE